MHDIVQKLYRASEQIGVNVCALSPVALYILLVGGWLLFFCEEEVERWRGRTREGGVGGGGGGGEGEGLGVV